MRILAFDTSSRDFSIALLEGEKLVFSETAAGFAELSSSDRGTNSLLIPAIKHALECADWDISSLELLATTIGPGSFTGLRVGVVTAKSLAYVHQTPIVAVDTLEVIAAKTMKMQGSGSNPQAVRVALNAQRKQLFSAQFVLDQACFLEKVGTTQIVGHDDWIQGLERGEFVSGPGLKPIVLRIESDRPDVVIADRELWAVEAGQVGLTAIRHFREGKRDDLWSILPEYYRPSAAEEKNSS